MKCQLCGRDVMIHESPGKICVREVGAVACTVVDYVRDRRRRPRKVYQIHREPRSADYDEATEAAIDQLYVDQLGPGWPGDYGNH